MLDYFFLSVGVFVGSFALRCFAGRGVKQNFDSYAHIYFAKCLKESSGGPFSPVSVAVKTSHPFYNPFMWHWLIGLFSITWVMRYQHLINPFLDALFSLFIFWLAIGLFVFWGVAFIFYDKDFVIPDALIEIWKWMMGFASAVILGTVFEKPKEV